ncbi:MAG TPA: LamG-like jellyroll fold domain-containing protein [Methylomirabilota bacterium]|nr:LamG-like jellyroll fold domain-containing protein [Methylomirabilota bacterium]
MNVNVAKSPPMSSGFLPALTAALAAAGLITPAYAQLEVAGELFVDVDATTASVGPVTSIPNSGTLGGFFEARGGGTTVPSIALEGGTAGIRCDGNDFMQLVDALGALVPPPAGLVGANPTATIEVWAYNQNILAEETLVSWGRRGGPDGSNMSFNYGTDGRWGAVGHWGAPDIGWINTGGAPAAGRWHHLVYTYDGSTTRVYADGVLMNQETLPLNTHANTSIQLAAQLEANGTSVTPGLRGSLTLGRVRIHDGALSDTQVLANYNMEKADFIDPTVTPTVLSSGPTHRWSFNEAATPDATGATFMDSVGGAHGTVLGAGASFTGTRLILPGGASGTQAYGDLPNQLISRNSAANSGSGQVSIEGWVRITGGRTWSRIFDIGSTTSGEITGPGGSGNGADYLFYSAQVGGDTGLHRLELRNEDPPGGGTVTRDFGTFGTFNNDLHFVVTWDEATGVITVYENGLLAGSITVDDRMSDLNDVNVWLGRSNFTGDQNAQMQIDEFRIYDHVLTAGEVLGNFQTGPNTVNDGSVPASIVGQPVAVTTYETYAARFSVAAAGSPAPVYQWYRNGVPIDGATDASYTAENVTLDDSGAVFSCVVSNFTGGTPNVVTSEGAALTVLKDTPKLKHRYSFGEAVGQTVARDSNGTADGELRGGATFDGAGRLTLDGASGYVNLPNDIVATIENITIEAWVQDDGSGGWARIFDFGNSAAGEDFPIGQTGAAGTQYMFLSLPSGLGNLRGAYTIGGGGAAEQLIEWVGNRPPAGQMVHIVWTSSGAATTGRLYVDGMLVNENRNVTLTPAALGPTSNNWLGRAQFNDPLFRGQYDEFRIWTGAMTPAEVAASRAAGPNAPICGVCLSITRSGGNITLRWPASASDYFLECSPKLGPDAAWDLVFDTPTVEGDSFVLTLSASEASKYFRLTR